MEENWYALLLAIFKNIDSHDAIKYVKYGVKTQHFKKHIGEDRLHAYLKSCKNNRRIQEAAKKRNEKCVNREQMYNSIIELRKSGKTWEQIGNQFGRTRSDVYNIVTRYEKRKAIANEQRM